MECSSLRKCSSGGEGGLRGRPAPFLTVFLGAAIRLHLSLLPLGPGLTWTLRGTFDRVMGLPASHMVGAMDKQRPETKLGSTLGSGRARDRIQIR